ncbi:MAG: hypothetical protein HYZ74_02720 [Elusimicrobia bacterium]|nr:hypothetical protein [Elusimicrobiota bacterium]
MTGLNPSRLRCVLGGIAAVFGLVDLAALAFVLLSSGGPAPIMISARAWSGFFFVHFIGLVTAGLGWLLAVSARAGVFHGGPFIDYLLLLTGFILVSSISGSFLGRGAGPSWPALLPGLFLVGMGLRLRNGLALL